MSDRLLSERELALSLSRRAFLRSTGLGLGSLALSELLANESSSASTKPQRVGGLPELPHFAPQAKRVIYLFQSGAPSQIDLFDYKPGLAEYRGQELPDSVRMGQRLTGMTSGQKSLPIAPSMFKFTQQGKNGTWLSELIPHLGKVVDDLCIVAAHLPAIRKAA